jgi:transposase
MGVGIEGEAGRPNFDARGRRLWSFEERHQIVAEALVPGASVAEVARRHGLNANLIFKWLKRARDGWPDRRRALPALIKPMTFIPVEVISKAVDNKAAAPARALALEHGVPPRPQNPSAKPTKLTVREASGSARRGAIEISLPGGARVSVDADVDEAALRLVLSAMKEA